MADRVSASWIVNIQRPPTDVFAYLCDFSRHNEWSPKAFRTEGLAPGPVTPGTTFASFGAIPGDKDHRNEVEVTEVVPPTKLVFKSTEPKGGVFVNTFTVTASSAGSVVERTMDMPKPGGVTGVVFPVFLKTLIRPAVQKGMNMLKEKVEATSSPTH
jgi:uncharacterized protein YndB with AHSA1/START domain